MTNLTVEIQEAIRKSLPEQTAHELKSYLSKAEKDAMKVVELELKVNLLEEEIKRKNSFLIKADNIENREINVKLKEEEIYTRTVQIKHTEDILKLRQEHATDIKLTAIDMMKIVFKSQPTGYAFSVSKTESGNEPQTGNNYGATVCTNRTSNESTIKREITD